MLPAKTGTVLVASLLTYAAVAGLLSLLQADYICADFVAYVTVAKRTIEHPWTTMTSYWAPLFSWMMIPFLKCGIDDLIAGRLVLLASGVFYLLAINRLTQIHSSGNHVTDLLIQIGMMTCATLQACIWSTYLLDPDLLANAFLYLYFCSVTDRSSRFNPLGMGLIGGMLAGAAYLAKAYMLPFCLLHFLLTIGLRRWLSQLTKKSTGIDPATWQTVFAFGVGLALVAGPWIVPLSIKSRRPTFSTAGSANHANISPENFRKDPLWHPGIKQDYIFEPYLRPNWSPVRDISHFQHQIQIVIHNVLNCIGLIPIWLIVTGICFATWILCKIEVSPYDKWYLVWIAMTVLVYCGGYTTVNLEARYIVPTVTPLLCHAILILFRSALIGQHRDSKFAATEILLEPISRPHQFHRLIAAWIPPVIYARPTLAVIAGVLLLSAVDLDNLIRIATRHPQSVKLEKFRTIANQLHSADIANDSIVCNEWHLGLYIAYAANRLTNYWGSPLSRSETELLDELERKDVKVFLRIVRETDPRRYYPFDNPFAESLHWKRSLTIQDPQISPDFVEVYVRD